MTIRSWIRFFFMTLLVGGVTTGIVGIAVRWNELMNLLNGQDIVEVMSVIVWMVGVGMTFSVLSQMGYFAYLTIHQFGLSIFRSLKLWNAVQLVLVAFVIFDLVYFRFTTFAGQGESLLPYIGLAGFLLSVGLLVAYLKTRQASKSLFPSALFFMVVVTTLEWLPVLRSNEGYWLITIMFTLMATNAYQILSLPKYNQRSVKEREERLARKAARQNAAAK
ncbi:KinB-signaling pathway activation protein [Jeotgalibacillus proteolyticus]|uniref:KinB-signaling pathway activation protein n=1 Tax=Jeotgalibacillus proteolyticus TaxID=2082395 RepID=A0A2S5G6N6_9BACL|nr:KinB-signaling pathway activation protein [Jeotgalibacillus proteolyticus]PPA68642.1 KinB-signaling pathway activation protein [Jeotgalibacillus proteolyticus]